MTRDDHARKATIRARMAATGESYSVAARNVDTTGRARARPATGVGTPPKGWPAWAGKHPAMVAVWRDRDGVDDVVVLDSGTDGRLAALSVPHVPTETLLADYEAAGLLGAPDSLGRHDRELEAALGRPDLTAHRLGYQVRGIREWHPWTDGSWRSPAAPADTRHTVTATPTTARAGGSGLRLVVREHPADEVVADATVVAPDTVPSWDRLNAALDPLGYTAAGGRWTRLPGGVLYARARPGHLAERDWWTLSRVRVVRQTRPSNIDLRDTVTYEVGEVLVMNQHGRAGAEIDRRSWWSSNDADGGYGLSADAVEVVEVLEDHPPTWQAAALTAEQVTALLAPYHPGAAQAAAAWAAAGLHIAHAPDGLVIRTPGPQYRRVGRIGRDYWYGNVHSDRYEVNLRDNELYSPTRELEELPLDPVAVADQLASGK